MPWNSWPLRHIRIVLVRPRFPENIGMVARAAANMGCPDLAIIEPELWDCSKALTLATPRGKDILDRLQLFPDLDTAIGDCNMAIGTTARLGRWRGSVLNPREAAKTIMDGSIKKAALVFGPEDRGLSNAEISRCSVIAHIPTAEASSLNLAQAALLMLYECFMLAPGHRSSSGRESEQINMNEEGILAGKLKGLLLELDCLHGENPDYFFRQWQQIIRRIGLRRHEFDALMGLMRQIENKINGKLP